MRLMAVMTASPGLQQSSDRATGGDASCEGQHHRRRSHARFLARRRGEFPHLFRLLCICRGSPLASRSQRRAMETFHAPTASACDPRRHGTDAGRMRLAAGEFAYGSRPCLVQVQDVRLGARPMRCRPATRGSTRIRSFRIGLRVPSRRPWRRTASHGPARRTELTCSCTITPA
jgi:hypothetical protein